jgi:hypothetical protein
MIRLLPVTTRTDPALMDHPGAFFWWYLDLVEEPPTPCPSSAQTTTPSRPGGDRGLVLIWSWALPFLPGLNSAARAGQPAVPRSRPSLNIAAYDKGREHGYLLQEYDPGDCGWERPDDHTIRWHFGRSRLEQVRDQGRLSLRIDLDCAVPGTERRWQGTVRLEGPLRQDPPASDQPLDGPTSHGWSPLSTVATAEAQLDIAGTPFSLRGRGYHDRNAAEVPLDQLGIVEWWWGRLAFPDRELIWYRLRPEGGGALEEAVVTVFPDGSCRIARSEMLLTSSWRSIWGLSHPRRLRFRDHGGAEVSVHVRHRVDDGPFYQRFLVTAEREGVLAHGTAEYVVPDRCDTALMRPLVRMRVHKDGGPNHSMAPFFAGPVHDRIARLRSTPPEGR